jgi:hypothetical protein
MMPTPALNRRHIALHLAHRWFAFLEAPGGDLDAHLEMFHPEVRLSGHRGAHVFARDRPSLTDWFGSIPEGVSSHHIVHSTYTDTDRDGGMLDMVVAYQAPGDKGVHGSIISYQTRVEFMRDRAWFVSLDKTPTLANTRPRYETSWAANRVLARVHADLGGITGPDRPIRAALEGDIVQVVAHATAPEGTADYEAVITGIAAAGGMCVLRVSFEDDAVFSLPVVTHVTTLAV